MGDNDDKLFDHEGRISGLEKGQQILEGQTKELFDQQKEIRNENQAMREDVLEFYTKLSKDTSDAIAKGFDEVKTSLKPQAPTAATAPAAVAPPAVVLPPRPEIIGIRGISSWLKDFLFQNAAKLAVFFLACFLFEIFKAVGGQTWELIKIAGKAAWAMMVSHL